MDELKPCKKCGSKNWALWSASSADKNEPVGYYVECDDCLWETDIYNTAEDAIEEWNRRAGNESD